MGSGISTKYEKTYFYSKGSNFNFYEEKEESEEKVVEIKSGLLNLTIT